MAEIKTKHAGLQEIAAEVTPPENRNGYAIDMDVTGSDGEGQDADFERY